MTPSDQNRSRRVMIFIDGSNVHWGLKTYKKQTRSEYLLDYEKLQSLLAGQRDLVRTIYYSSAPSEGTSPGQVRFWEYLRSNGIQVVIKTLRKRINPSSGEIRLVEKGVDVALTIDLLALAWEGAYDVAVIFSGDGDYVEAVKQVMNKGKNVEILAFRSSCSVELRESALRITFFEDIAGMVKLM
jgi:uncharacterized LabA/DUF88 family protein